MSFLHHRSTLAGVLGLCAVLAACGTPAPQTGARASQGAPRVLPVEADPMPPATQPAIDFVAATSGPVAAVLAYADKVRSLTGPDLGAEIGRLGDPGEVPLAQLQLALALSQTRVSADLARATALAQRVAANPAPEAQPLQPLARLLATRYLEQRRIEDERDRQAQLLRDSQRRIDQLNDRIEALRAIERSFARPPAAAAPPAPATGPKPQP